MKEILPPKHDEDYPDRSLDCEEAMVIAFNALVRQAVAAGWNEKEVALILADIADEHVVDVAERSALASLKLN